MTEQPLPATLLRLILLLAAGIEANLGPLRYCSFPQVRLDRRDWSVRCDSCNGCCPLRCSGFTKSTDFSPVFTCPGCPLCLYLLLHLLSSPCSSGFTASTAPYLPSEDSLVLGDFNAHYDLWCSNLAASNVEHVFFEVLNEDNPTSLPPNGVPSSPDVSLASLSLVVSTTWSTEINLWRNHLPILPKLATAADRIKAPNRHFINFNQAHWAAFTAEYEADIDLLPPSTYVHRAERALRQLLLETTSHHIPNGYIPLLRPNYPPETSRLERERDDIR
ncbi:unnamed protein product [Dibothriocephalus latus]|uniref:Endonuclease/exonuclease/phosphatase domain-containing protein n=1 Tax=Dibothriocephalus latus TaxID=60516 RepID=A0A3P7LTE5_DIBLA|nr:unnamed protein product [Dibothriocephalus latus]